MCCAILKKNSKQMNNQPTKLQLEQNDGKTIENYFFDKKSSNNGIFFPLLSQFNNQFCKSKNAFLGEN
jgi:hypothetical protein